MRPAVGSRAAALQVARRSVFLLALVVAGPAGAQSFMSPLVGGFVFSGPASAHVTSIYYNPAAIGLIDGTAFHLSFQGTFDSTSIDRAPISPATGAVASPGTPGARTFAGVRERTFAPGGFFGLTTDLGTDNVTLGVALYTPYYEWRAPGKPQPVPGQDGPTRFHLLETTQYHLFITPVVSFRVVKEFYVGAGIDVVWSDLANLTFDRDTALEGKQCDVARDGVESDACTERVRVKGSNWSVSVPVGILIRPFKRLDIGVTYRSGLFGTTRANVPFIGSGTLTSPGDTTGHDVFARTTMHVPHMLLAGMQLELTPRLDLGLSGRWLHWASEEVMEVRLSSASATERDVPERIALYRGYQDTFTVKALFGYRPVPVLRLGFGGIVQSPPIATRAVSPAVVDGWQLWGLVLGEVQVLRWMSVSGGYGLRVMLPRSPDASIFDPLYQVDCAASRYDIPTCRPANRGRGVASGAGKYTSYGHQFGVASTVQF
jgi:long-subunit fatty acid transport protein